MALEKRSLVSIKLAALQRLVMLHGLSGALPLYPVLEFPRSGGTWFGQMWGRYLGVPFPRNRRPPLAPCIMHGHHLYSPRFENAVYVIRDGRDCMVSAYYKRFLVDIPRVRRRFRKDLPFDEVEDVERNLPAFIEYMFTTSANRPFHFSWSEFARSILPHDVPMVRYEDLLQDAAGEVARIARRVVGEEPEMDRLRRIEEEFSFERQSKRPPGTEDTRSHMRKGVAGDWKTKFGPEAREVFDHFAGRELVELGYEPDRSWVTEG